MRVFTSFKSYHCRIGNKKKKEIKILGNVLEEGA